MLDIISVGPGEAVLLTDDAKDVYKRQTTYRVNVFSKDNEAATYEDKLLELIRSGALQADASEKPEEPPAEHAA